MQFDYFSLTEENKKKWAQSIVITVSAILLFNVGLLIYLNKKFTNYGIPHPNKVAILLIILLVSRVTLSTI